MKNFLWLKLAAFLCVFHLSNVSFAQYPFPPDRFPVIVDGTQLEINDCSGRRFFLSGMVDNYPNSGLQLSAYDHAEMEAQVENHEAIGATAMRWNTFLRGRDLRWDANGYVTGMCDSAVAHIKDGLDLAYEHGIVIQIVLSTAHFLQWGWDGETPENVTRVNNNKFMFEDTVATQAYIDNVIKPITQTIGVHPGLMGYCIINEASGMYYAEDAETGTWSDVKVHLVDFQGYVNRVASEIHTNQPGAICSVSGVAYGIYQYGDSVLIAQGGKSNGTMDIHQVQFYPQNHPVEWSPYVHTPQEFVTAYGGGLKPFICGETPIEGVGVYGLGEAYELLWTEGHSGGFTWSLNVYEGMNAGDKATVDAAYTDLYDAYLVNNDFNGSQCSNHLYATPVSQTVPVSAGNTDLIVISDKNWSASDDAGWCSLSPSSGSNNDTITVSYTVNTGAERTANITLSATGVSDYIVSVYQEGDFLHVLPDSSNVGRSSGIVNLTVSSNLSNWSAVDDAGWCTLSPSSGSNNDVVVASITENTGAERTANITFSVSGAPDVVVTITQAQYESIGVFQQSTETDKIVSVEAEHYIRAIVGTGAFSTHSWIETNTPSGYSGNSAKVTNPNNGTNASNVGDAENYAPRLEFDVNFTETGTHYVWLRVYTNSSNGDNSIHAGLNGSISAANMNLGTGSAWAWKELLNAGGARATINVPSTGEHTFGLFMREDGAHVDKIVLTTNVNYTPTGTGPAESEQTGASSLNVTPANHDVSPSADSVDFTVTSNVNWSVSDDAGWLTLNPSSGSNNGTVTASYTENTGAERIANITFSASGVSDVVRTVTQEAKSLAVTPANYDVSSSADSVDFTVTSNVSWSAVDDAGWLTLNPSSGSNNGTVTASYTENTGVERTANITFSASGVSDVVRTVIQADGTSANGFQQDSGSDKIVSMEGENYHNNIDGSGSYSTHSWISTSTPTGYSGDGAMVTDPNNGTNISSQSDAENYAPTLEFVVNFVTTGTHYIWLHVNSNNSGSDNSIHAGLDGSITALRLECGINSNWIWKSFKAGGSRPTINVTSTGEHTFGLFMREDGLKIDKIVLTTNVDYVPTGMGPAESYNGGGGRKSATLLKSLEITIDNELSLNIYPNPSSGNVHINLGNNQAGDVRISIVNLNGQAVLTKQFHLAAQSKGVDVSLPNLVEGVYLIKLQMAGQTRIKKLVVK